MSAQRSMEERAAAFVANFEEKVDSLVNREKASFKQFCQSEFNKLKENNTTSSFEDSGVPDFDCSSVVNSTVLPQPPELHSQAQFYPLQVYVPPPPILARLLKVESPKVSPPRPVIVPVRRSGRKSRETNKFTYSPSHIKVQKSRKRKRTMSMERIRCNLDDEFEAEEAGNLSLEADADLIQTPTSPRSPIPVAVVQPRIASPFPVGYGEPDLLDLMQPIDPFDLPAPPTATPVPLDEVSLYGEVEADAEADEINDEDQDYVGLEQTAQLYDELGLGMQPLSDNDEEVERINAFLDDERPLSSLTDFSINLDSTSTGLTSVSTSCASMSELDLTCNENYEPDYGQVRFEDGEVEVCTPASDDNNDESNMTADSTSVMATPSSGAPPPYQQMGAYRCHQCGALNNIATSSWISPPPPYEAHAQPAPPAVPQFEDDAPVPNPGGAVAPGHVPPVVPAAAAAAVEAGNLDDFYSGPGQEINFIGMQPDGRNYNSAQPPNDDDYGQREQIPFRDLLGPADEDSN